MQETTEHVHCECGSITSVLCEWSGPKAQTVTVEYMPECWRASHEDARNYGTWPHNRAERLKINVVCAASLTVDPETGEPNEWCKVVE